RWVSWPASAKPWASSTDWRSVPPLRRKSCTISIFIARNSKGGRRSSTSMTHPLVQLLVRWSVLALGVTLATKLVPGISCNDPATLIIVVVVLSFLNAVFKPLLMLFALPFILVTMGLGIVLINAALFWLVGQLVEGFAVA